MTTGLTPLDKAVTGERFSMSEEQIELITRTVAKGCSKDELALFLHACAKTGLDPLMKQIYAVKRGPSMAIQTGIDGLRLVAERTGRYAPGREPSFTYTRVHEKEVTGEELESATAYIKKMTPDGTWHEVAATALYVEYVQRTQSGDPTSFWKRMPHVMLGKVAEALALRRAFPMELSGIYSSDEMSQADSEQQAAEKFPRLRGIQAVESAPVVVAEPDVVGSGEAERVVEGGGASEPVGRGAGSDEAAKRKLKLEAAITGAAPNLGVRPATLRDRVKEKILDEFQKEHFVELTPLEHAKVMHWLVSQEVPT